MDLYKDAAIGAQAKALMENDVYKNAIATVRQAIFDKWEQAPIRDTEGQQQLKLMLKLLNDIESNIKTAADTGRLAELQIQQEAEKENRLKSMFKFGAR